MPPLQRLMFSSSFESHAWDRPFFSIIKIASGLKLNWVPRLPKVKLMLDGTLHFWRKSNTIN